MTSSFKSFQKLTEEQKKKLLKHKKFHIENNYFNTKIDLNRHMRLMRVYLMKGKTFQQAHELAISKGPAPKSGGS